MAEYAPPAREIPVSRSNRRFARVHELRELPVKPSCSGRRWAIQTLALLFTSEFDQSGSLHAVRALPTSRVLEGDWRAGYVSRRASLCYDCRTVEETLDTTINTRVPRRLRQALEQVAGERRVNPLTFARTLLDEGLRRERHPGIVFREGPVGRRAAIEGRRLDVWQVMETLWASDGNVEEAADYLGLRPDQVRAAVGYYTEYPDEIDAWVRANQEEADRLRSQWEREQASLRR